MSEQFSGTKEVSEFLKFDLEKLNLYIKENCQAISKINSYEQFKGGQSNPSYLLIFRTYVRALDLVSVLGLISYPERFF